MADNDSSLDNQIVSTMPAPIAVAFAEYQQERSAFKKLHRLVDAYETVMKYAAVLAIQNFYDARLSAVFPEGDDLIRRQIDRPSLGSWAKFLEEILKCFAEREADVFCRALYLFQYKRFGRDPVQQEHLKPNGAAGRLLTLRNDLAHGATLSDDAAEYRLIHYARDLEVLLEKAAFFKDFPLLYVHQGHDSHALQIQPLMGAPYSESPPTTLTTQLPVDDLTDHLVVYHAATERFLDLHPLLIYTECEESIPQWDRQRQLLGTAACQKRKILFYNDLKDDRRITFLDYQQGHLSRFRTSEQNSLPKTFRQRFAKPERSLHNIDWFDAFIHDRTAHFVGRERELAEIDRYVAEGVKAVLIVGEPGVGKSTLLAKWASDHQAIRHFIREGDAGTYKPISVFGNLIRQLRERFGVEPLSSPQPDPLAYRQAFSEVLQAATNVTGEPVVIVVDGLDEAARSAFYSSERDSDLSIVDYLPDPSQLPNGVCLLVSTRPALLDHSAFAAKFERDKAKRLTLGKLTEIEVRALLYQVRSKYDVLAAPEYVEAVVKQSEGNPLYLKMLVEDLAERQLVFGQTDALPTGVVAYFKRILDFIENADHAHRLVSHNAKLKTQRDLLETLVAQNRLTRSEAEEILTNEQSKHEGHERSNGIETLVLYCLAKEPLTLDQVASVLHAEPIEAQRAFALIRTVLVDEGQGRFTIFHSRFRDYVLHLNTHSDTRLQPYAEMITRVRLDLLAYCARWREHRDPYALRRYAEHLQEAQQLEALYALARDEEFRQAQAEAFPNDPDLTLQTVQMALLCGAETDAAAVIVEFLWLHARRLQHLRQESPLEALRAGDLQRSWELADLYESEPCVLWHLLLAWELKERQRSADAHATLARLLERELPKLSDQAAEQASQLLLWMPNTFAEEFRTLQRWILTDRQRHHLYRGLSTDSQFLSALTVVRDLNTWTGQAQALIEIATTAARIAQPDAWRATLEAALAIAQEITEPLTHVKALSALAATQAQRGDAAGAAQTLQAALHAIFTVDAGLRQEDALQSVLEAQAQMEEPERRQQILSSAQAIARQLTPAPTTIKALKAVADAQAQTGNVQIARDILATVSDYAQTSDKDQFLAYAVAEVAQAQARYGDHTAAQRSMQTTLAIVRGIKDEWNRNYTLKSVITHCSELSQLLLARDIAQNFAVEILRAEALSNVAAAFARGGDFSAALATAQTIADEEPRTKVLVQIAELQAKVGDREAARNTFVLAREAAQKFQYKPLVFAFSGVKSMTPPDQQRKNADETLRRQISLLTAIARAQAQVGEFTEAKETVQKIADKSKRAELLSEIAEQQAKRGDQEAARITFQAARATANNIGLITIGAAPRALQVRISNDPDRARSLAHIAIAQAQVGELQEARATALRINLEQERKNALKSIAQAQKQLGAFAAARETAELIKNEDSRYEVLREIMSAQAQAGDFEGALAIARSITNRTYRTSAFQLLIALRERATDAAARSEAQTIADELAELVKQGQALPPVVPATKMINREVSWWDQGRMQMQAGHLHAARTDFAAAINPQLREKEDWPQVKALQAVTLAKVYTQSQRREFIPALETARRIHNFEDLHEALKILAVALAQAGDIEAAEFILQAGAEFLFQAPLPSFLQQAVRAQIEIYKARSEARTTTLVYEEASALITFSPVSSVMAELKKRLLPTTGEDPTLLTISQDSAKPYQTWQGLTTLAVIQAYTGKFSAAFDAVGKISELEHLVLVLKAVLAILAQVEQQEIAREGFSDAFVVAQDLGNMGAEAEWHAEEALLAIAITQAWAGLIDDARQTAQEIHDSWYEASALKAVALAQARAGLFAQAVETASTIEEEQYRTEVLDFLAGRQIARTEDLSGRTGFDSAVENRWGFLGEIDYYAARSGLEVQSLTLIGSAQAAAGDQQRAQHTLAAAFNSAWRIEKETERAEALTAVAIAQIRAGFSQEAIQTTDSILVARNQHLLSIAEAFANQGDREHFKQLLVPCAYYADAVPRLCGLLARGYPEQAETLLQAFTNET